ncbi:v-myb avian myeloblastosis viral oncogene homolog-like 2a [Pimephales promelas]|uniref:v-myb avian myeloblastosis viral oncogene homolog-like 2a n=1 Tax=Pimephales promelas TaxID=90988 RepID=UPI001955A43B|nr:v-myb avian myeloblastosis viral oncogene homolog-like 2a [Pimephales promelas]XP_039527441.1 v-myb avian myeloblastosis viral oncogene homolog-like 2a [Pimephales promelas]XP_039527442.1 v-myb avian myeloblastosis viral oncogene homolog-like 2a [Pimephales promelas]KAG1927335.1 transcriptional activator Myb [Pimephales promelas]
MEAVVSLNPKCVADLESDIDEDIEPLKSKWTSKEDETLASLVVRFGREEWELISGYLPGRSAQECKNRFTMVLDPELIKGTWTKEEDERLIQLVSLFGDKKWSTIAKHLKGRRGKQCRERWHNHLDPSVIKTPWTTDEDLLIVKCHCVLGSRWAQIAKFLPGRTDNSIKNHWYSTLKRKMDKGDYKMEDVDLSDLGIYLTLKETSASTSHEKSISALEPLPRVKPLKRKASDRTPKADSPPLYPSSPSYSRSPSIVDPQHKAYVDDVLQMIAEDMLPLNFTEGCGFRKFMTAVGPQHPQLSQRTIASQLYSSVEKTIKPRLIQQLRKCVTLSGGRNVVHITADIWASEHTEPLLAVQMHFLDDDWSVHSRTVAFRHLQCNQVTAQIGAEIESVLLSFGLFPHNIGYSIIHEAKNTIATHDLFCDYKIMCSAQKSDPDEEELLSFLDDQVTIDDFSIAEISSSKHLDCITSLLHCVIKEAIKKSRVVERILFEVQSVVSFFRRSAYWLELLAQKCKLSLFGTFGTSGYTWNSTISIIREIMQESVWDSVMSLVDQAHAEVNSSHMCPPVVRVTREQVVEFVGFMEPFEEVVQVLQEDGVTLSLIIPTIIGLDKTLESKTTKLSFFCSSLRSALRSYFQPLILRRDLILATVLDPRIKLQPFDNGKEKFKTSTLFTPSKQRASLVVESALSEAARETGRDEPERVDMSELTQYLSEPLSEEDVSVQSFWKEATRFPCLRSICRKWLAVPASSGGFKRLFPLACSIVRARRSKLTQHTAERLLLYREHLSKSATAEGDTLRSLP